MTEPTCLNCRRLTIQAGYQERAFNDLRKAFDKITEPCETCDGTGELVADLPMTHIMMEPGYYTTAVCGECDGWGRVPKRSPIAA